jgi:hypothetical protein
MSAFPLPALKTPHENALVAGLGSAQDTYAPSEVNNFSLTVNGEKWHAIVILAVRGKAERHANRLRTHATKIPGDSVIRRRVI